MSDSSTPIGSPISLLDDEQPSPCIGVCEMDPRTDLCLGCYRTIAEITDWFKLEEIDKRAIVTKINERRAAEAVATSQA